MDTLQRLVGITLLGAIFCITLSTWVTVSELREIVDETEAKRAKKGLDDNSEGWQDFAHKAIGHIEHLPRLPYGVHLPGLHGNEELADAGATVSVAAGNTPEFGMGTASTGGGQQHADSSKAKRTFAPALDTPAGQCFMFPHTDYFGEAVKSGPANLKDTAAECCEDCLNFKPATSEDAGCNVWVWCGDRQKCGNQYRHCWLKHLPWVYASKPRSGDTIPWTSGLLEEPQLTEEGDAAAFGGPQRSYHTVTTAQGSTTHWQIRVHYYWFKKQQKKCREIYGKNCQMGGFTRLLHSGQEDDLMQEVPTHVANPLPKGSGGYIVLNRPYAFMQWVKQVTLKEDYVLMSEPDHVFLRPLQNLMKGDAPAAFPFFYIEPSRKDYVHIAQKFAPGIKNRRDAEQVAPIGNSPTFMRFDHLKQISEEWVNTSIAIFKDPEANKEWGWVMEMYAFTLSLYNHNIGPVGLHLELASQPPWDTTMDMNGVPYYILHYTYGMDYTLEGTFTPGKIGAWRFDKRSYAYRPPPRNLSKPPDGMKNDLVRFLINAINEASEAIPGWDEYVRTGKATELMHYDD